MPITYNPSVASKHELLKPGPRYRFKTVSCEEGQTKDNRSMITLNLIVYDENGYEYEHTMYLVIPEVSYHVYHLKKYWESVGHPEMFETMKAGIQANLFAGQRGFLLTKIENSTYKDKTSGQLKNYTKSVVDRFIAKDEEINQSEKIDFLKDDIDEIKEDEIPF